MKPPSLSSYLFATTLQIAMDDAMDTTLDAQPIFTSSSDENFYLSPSVSDDYPELDWQESQRTALIKKMNMMSRALRWPHRLASIESVDDEVWLFADILVHLTEKLSKTDLHSKFIPPKQHEAAKEFFEMFNDTDFNRWLAGVQKAVHNDDWDDLIAHPTLRRPSSKIIFTQESKEEKAKRLNDMFRTKYRGDAAKSFACGIDDYSKIYDPKKHYGRSIAVLQSSATGKSRMVEELGNEVPTLSVCFRTSDQPNAGWPPVDKPAYDFFRDHSSDEYQAEKLAAVFIGALMGVIVTKLKDRIAERSSLKKWMKDWELDTPTEVQRSSRFRSFQEVRTAAESMLLEKFESLPKSEDKDAGLAYDRKLYEKFCLPNAERLSKIISEAQCNKFVIAFDECSILNFQRPLRGIHDRWASTYMSLIALQRIIKAGDGYDRHGVTIWYLLLDTNLSIFDLAPVGPHAPSNRLTDELRPLPTWPYIGFNQMVDPSHVEGIQTAADVLSLKHLKVYGRPYWSGLRDDEVVAAAKKKLFLKEFNPRNEDHVFAAFAVRIGLEIAEGEASECLARNAVQSHMRILIGAHDQVVITVTPSEPMLAIAAADALNDFLVVYKDAMTTLVNRLILRGLVLDQGIKGDLCTRLLFTLARDRAVTPIVVSADLPYIQAVSLSQFLKTLLGDDLGTSHQLSLHPDFLPRLSNIWINFTHFVQLSAPVSELEPAFLLEAWSSGIAFQCAPLQPVIDGFFVCYEGALDGSFDIRKLTVVPWQTKAKSKAAASTLVSQLTAPSILVVENGQIDRRKTHPLVIFMDLGTSSSFQGTDRYVDLTLHTPTVPTKRGTWDGYARPNEQEPEQYCLDIRGHSSSTYDIMKHFGSQLGPLFCRSFVCTTPEFEKYLALMHQAMQRVTIKEE